MKKSLLFTGLLLAGGAFTSPRPALSQTTDLVPVPLNQPLEFRVVRNTADTTLVTGPAQEFRLKETDLRAAALTGTRLARIDRSAAPLLKIKAGKQLYMLPELYLGWLSGSSDQISYRIVVTDSAPLEYDPDQALFEGGLEFLPVATEDFWNPTPAQRTLASADTVYLLFGNSRIAIGISRLNWPPVFVKVTSPDPVDSMLLKIQTIGNRQGYETFLKVEPAVFLSSGRSTLEGLGLQTIPIHVALIGVTRHDPVKVTLESSLGSLDSAEVILRANEVREVGLRSEKWGPFRVRIAGSAFRSNVLDLHAEFPWLFLLLALAGGLLGAVMRILKGRKKFRAKPLLYGTLSGFIVSLAYWGIGILLISIPFKFPAFNETAVFVLAVLAGYLELEDLRKLAARGANASSG
jgi:hypothetical protein